MRDVTITKARGQKQRGGVRSSHHVLHIPVFSDGLRTWCGRMRKDVNCTPDEKPSVSKVDGDSTGYTYSKDEVCKRCLKGYWI